MDQVREENLEESILELFRKESVSTIVLAGKAGIGKSWMAKKVSVCALEEDVFDLSLWVYLSVKHKEKDLYQCIAGQLSVYSTVSEVDIDESKESANNISEEEDLEVLQNLIFTKLSGNRLLLVLDDEGKKMSTEDNEISNLLEFLSGNTSKVLITSVNENTRHKTNGSKKVIDLKPLSPERSLSLMQQRTVGKVFAIADAKAVVEEFLNRNIDLTPAEVVMIATLLSSYQHDSGSEGLRSLLEDLHNHNNNLSLTLTSSNYNKVPSDIFADFNWLVSHCFYDQGALNYSELIAYWVMEGYLGPINCTHEAYDKGHQILMELIDLRVLKRINANYLCIENLFLDLKDCHHPGFGGKGSIGFAKVLSDIRKIGEVVQIDGTITTPSGKRKAGNISTLLQDGNCLSREDLEIFLENDDKMQVLCLFSPRITCLPQTVSEMKMLTVLILRGCDFLENINSIKKLKMLTVLEVSDAKSLTDLPDDIFAHQNKLQSLNLSGLQIEVLPTSAYDLTEMQWLILKGCANIKRLRSMKKWKKLVVLDLAGAVSFKNFAETSLKSLRKLQFLDLSNTNIRSLPFLHQIEELTHLSVRGCRNMSRLPSICSLSKLQFLDLSGAGIKEFQDHSFQKNVSLKILDLSATTIPVLPSSISSHHFYLKGCSQLQKMNCFEAPEKLEVLDLSGASNLADVDVQFFEKMINLRILNLSRTKVKVLPPISDAQNLRELLLSCCLDLEKLPVLSSLSKLEVLDLSGCRSLTTLEYKTFGQLTRLQQLDLSETSIKTLPELSSLSNLKELNCHGLNSITRADFLEHMNKLQILDLSDTQLHEVPHMPCFQNLTYLSLRNCRHIESLPNLENFTRLEILDLSGTSIRHLPSFKGLRNLRKLLLKGCLNLKELADINIHDLSGVVIRDLPYGISELTQLLQLALPNMQNIEENGNNVKYFSTKMLNEYHWAISSLNGKGLESKRLSLSLSGSEFFELLEKNPSLWDKSFKHFHFSIHPTQLQNGMGGMYFRREEYEFRDIYLQSMNFHNLDGSFHSLEIHGFDTFPKGVENVLRRAEYIFLLDNWFVKSLADLGAENLRMMRGCWIARSQTMETLMHPEKVADFVELRENLEMLWISSARSLKNLYCGNLQGGCFHNLKYLYLDCCPGLSSIFPQSHFLQSLEILHIKFCDGMKFLFEHNSEKHTFLNLRKLYLWELPELERIDCIMPSLQFLEVGRCPMLKHVLPSTCIPDNLRAISIQYCDTLHTLVEGMTEENCNLPSLERIKLSYLPELTNIGIDLPSLSCSCIKNCPKLQIAEHKHWD